MGMTYDFVHLVVDAINKLLRNFLYYELSIHDIEYAHVLPTRSGKAKKTVILVKFRNRFAKYDIYDNRKELKGTGVSVTEHLTAANLQLLAEARATVGFVNVWTSQTKILANFDGVITHVKGAEEIKNLREKFLQKYPEGLPENYRAPRKNSGNYTPRRSVQGYRRTGWQNPLSLELTNTSAVDSNAVNLDPTPKEAEDKAGSKT